MTQQSANFKYISNADFKRFRKQKPISKGKEISNLIIIV
jgi:hypothetical protein